MSNNNTIGKEYTFWQMLSECAINIPIIQRDYAQGRKNNQAKKIRIRFVQVLFNAIAEHKRQQLDLIYGCIINSDNKKIMQPLDGQQRLTTLFLLHWFMAFRAGAIKNTDVQKTLSKFSYATRVTSGRFCTCMSEADTFDVKQGVVPQIENTAWFMHSWGQDPTIKSMLVMLNSIEEEFNKNSTLHSHTVELWNKLISDNSPITFMLVSLEKMGLSDDIYTRMNARGKELTSLEHFKAAFEKYIIEKEWENVDTETTSTDSFSTKIDTTWTDLFWKYKNENNQIDGAFIRFIAGIAMNICAYSDAPDKEKQKRIQKLSNEPDDVEPADFPTKECFDYLVQCLDLYCEKDNKGKYRYNEISPEPELKLWLPEGHGISFKHIIHGAKPSYVERELFYAHTMYLLEHGMDNPESYSNWMRVVRNIVKNRAINRSADDVASFIGAIKLIKELSPGCGGIYKYLVDNGATLKSGLAKAQVTEERHKAKIILASTENKTAIFDAEDSYFCQGRISFVLYCMDIDVHASGQQNIVGTFDHHKLSAILKPIKKHLATQDISHEFRRALLTIQGNDFYEYHPGWSYNTDSRTYFLIKDTAELLEWFTDTDHGEYKRSYADYLKELLQKLTTCTITALIATFGKEKENDTGIPNWKRRLIAEPKLLDKACLFPHRFGIIHEGDLQKEYCLLFRDRHRPKSTKNCKKIK